MLLAKGRQMANESTFPPDVYGFFCGGINQDNANKLCSTMAVCMNNNVEHVHLLFQSLGGSVSDGIFLHSFFKSLPIQLTLYNAGRPDNLWAQLDHHDLYLSATEAVQFGIAQEIDEFSPPAGAKVFNVAC